METMERDAAYIASQCRFLRKMLSLTQENLADAAGLTVRTIQKVESGRHTPEVQTLRSIARGVGFDVAIFDKPTPAEEKRQQQEMERALRQTTLVPTSPIKNANDFYSQNSAWHAIIINTDAVQEDAALAVAASISEWMDDLHGIWEISTASQRLEYASSIAALCEELETLGYLTHFGHFRQQHTKDKGTVWKVGLISFLPKAGHDGDRYGLITLDDLWEIPEQDRPPL